ncbi:MAG: glycosyltransferase [Desulfobacteraceae bacterium]|nr:glycosyltransferase [Desulfobacteraceae bacterium]
MTQNYPNFEHIVVDGGSTDQTLQVLKPYRHLKVISEPDRGQADAINKGFRMTTGEIRGYLNSDDTLLPNALHSIAREIDPENGRHIIMGRCRFIDGSGEFLGIEHPSHFKSHSRVLEVWKGHLIPQPAVFWTRQVWDRCGGMDEDLGSQWIDYDLFCRFSKEYSFHCVDQILATYRLHEGSKSERSSAADRLEEAVRISRRYWGPAVHPRFWQLALSLALYRFNRVGRARRLFAEAKEASRNGHWARAVMYASPAGILAPEVAFYVAIYPFLEEKAKGPIKRALEYLGNRKGIDPRTAVYFDQTDPWDDNFIGPYLSISRYAPEDTKALLVKGEAYLSYMRRALSLVVMVDGLEIGRLKVKKSGSFLSHFPLPKGTSSGQKKVEIRATAWYIPHHFLKNGDFRPLSWRMEQVDLVTDKEVET